MRTFLPSSCFKSPPKACSNAAFESLGMNPENPELAPRSYCLCWEERFAFGPCLSDPYEPDIEARDLTGERTLWIRVGKPEPARVQKAADQNGRAHIAVVFDSPQRMAAFVEAAGEAKRLAR